MGLIDVSIEYAHIYTNEEIGLEHENSIATLTRAIEKIESESKTHKLVVMVDDYSFPDPTFNYLEFVDWLASNNFAPDIMIRESQLIPDCDEVLSRISRARLKNQVTKYVTTHKKYPCSLFIATWYLIRLGEIQSAVFPSENVAEQILNILPDSFKPFEDQALAILEDVIPGVSERIKYSFHEGRLIA